jgi:hypothetical protein
VVAVSFVLDGPDGVEITTGVDRRLIDSAIDAVRA